MQAVTGSQMARCQGWGLSKPLGAQYAPGGVGGWGGGGVGGWGGGGGVGCQAKPPTSSQSAMVDH